MTRAILTALFLAATPVVAQDWSFIDPLLARSLDIQPGEGGATLLPDDLDPNAATVALGFHYYESRTGGNAVMLNVGLFRQDATGWRYTGPVEVFGWDPREARFSPGQIELTTTTLGPGEPRCCPTAVTQWVIDTATGTATRLN